MEKREIDNRKAWNWQWKSVKLTMEKREINSVKLTMEKREIDNIKKREIWKREIDQGHQVKAWTWQWKSVKLTMY